MNSKIAFLAAAACLFAAGHAAATPTFGSASESTYRDCSTTPAGAACDGTLEPNQRIVTSVITGGAFSTADTDLTLSGQTVPAPGGGPGTVTVPNDGSFARSTVTFGALDLPIMRGSTQAFGDERLNINSIGYQSYDYAGASGTPFSLTGSLTIDDSSSDGGSGVLEGGAIYTAYVAIWDPSVLAGLTTAGDIFNNAFLADCSTSGVLAVGTLSGGLAGGPATISVTTSSCSGGPLILTTGEEVLAVSGLQLPVNRGGFADASHTYVTTLGADLSVEDQAALTAGLRSGASILAVPEPATWTMLLMGFLGLGLALRWRRASAA